MAYTPPSLDNINFDMPTGYTAPSLASVNFTIGGATTTTVDCINSPFETSTQFSPDEVPEWVYPLIPIEGNSEVGIPNLTISLPAPGLGCNISLTGSPQPRVNCFPLVSGLELTVKGIQEVPEGFTVISPWPLELTPSMSMDGVAMVVSDTALETYSGFGTPAILASGGMTVDLEPLSVASSIDSDLFISAVLEPMETGGSQLDILAIKSMPVGDQYLFCLPFETGNSLAIPVPLLGFSMPAFEVHSALTVATIFHGKIAVLEPMQISEELSSLVNAALELQPFHATTELSSGIGIDVSVYSSPVEVSSSLDVEDIVIGEFVELIPFETSSTAQTGINVSVWLTEHLTVTSGVNAPGIVNTVICEPFEANNSVYVSDIKIFNLDFATQFYYFKLTDPKGDQGDIWIPISSFQSRRRNGAPSYLQVVIPGYDYVPDIEARVEGNLEVYLTYKLESEIVRQTKIIDATLDEIRIDEGSSSKSVTLTGYKTETFISKSVELEGATYRSTKSGKLRYRIATPSTTLNPGDTVSISGDSFVADVVSYYFGAKRNGMTQNMEVAEA